MAQAPSPLTVPLSPSAILDRLDRMARRGKLADFRPAPAPALFALTAYGHPFDHTLTVAATERDGSTTLTFALTMRRAAPLIAAAVIAVSIWPGVWLTDSMIRTYWTAYDTCSDSWWLTASWYLPLTALPVPWMWVRLVRRSRLAAEAHAAELAEAIAAELARSL